MTPLSETDKKLLHDVDLYGWHVIKVPEDELGPSFGYSVGLYHTFGHPEILVIGLELDTIHFLINKLGDAIREGIELKPGQFYSHIIHNIDCYFTNVDSSYYKEYVSYAEWFYEGNAFPLVQCIYPTLDGTYPWQPKWPEALKRQQPVLGPIPTA